MVTIMVDEAEKKPQSIAAKLRSKRRVRVKRRLGDAQQLAGGSGVFIGDMRRSAGLELVEVDDKDPRDVFEG